MHPALRSHIQTLPCPPSFAHALWVSSRTASTLGFTSIYPDPDCVAPNLLVMLQVRNSKDCWRLLGAHC